MKSFSLVCLAAWLLPCALAGCRQTGAVPGLTDAEKALINGSDSVMRVLVVGNPSDEKVLRSRSIDFSDQDLQSEEYATLASYMLRTVTDPSQDGVGIAGPQVGIGRRIIAVQRFDKEGEPFEVYPNIRVESLWGEVVRGQEGCLSIPGRRGVVPRYSGVTVSYKDPCTLETVCDSVEGFTAVIFQHETDHLEGILYTDRADSVFVK